MNRAYCIKLYYKPMKYKGKLITFLVETLNKLLTKEDQIHNMTKYTYFDCIFIIQ